MALQGPCHTTQLACDYGLVAAYGWTSLQEHSLRQRPRLLTTSGLLKVESREQAVI